MWTRRLKWQVIKCNISWRRAKLQCKQNRISSPVANEDTVCVPTEYLALLLMKIQCAYRQTWFSLSLLQSRESWFMQLLDAKCAGSVKQYSDFWTRTPLIQGVRGSYMVAAWRFLVNADLTLLLMTCSQGEATGGACSTYVSEMHTKFA